MTLLNLFLGVLGGEYLPARGLQFRDGHPHFSVSAQA